MLAVAMAHWQQNTESTSAESVAAELTIPEGFIALTYDSLDTSEIVKSVADDGAGAIAVFIGTTRNTFQGTYTPI